MANTLQFLPEITGMEQSYIDSILKTMDDEQANYFANAYRMRRKDPQTILLLTLVGFLGIAGIQRFIVDNIGLGILYFLTGGLCGIGTIIDAINYKSIAFEYNQKEANQIASVIMRNNPQVVR